MNYITRLQADVAAKDAEIAALRAGLEDFRTYLLTSPKFGNRPAGSLVSTLDRDGMPIPPAHETAERVDWISISEAVGRLRAIEATDGEG